jgi:hypothetical protein
MEPPSVQRSTETITKAGKLSRILKVPQLSAKPVEADAASFSPAMQLWVTIEWQKELTGYTHSAASTAGSAGIAHAVSRVWPTGHDARVHRLFP